MDTSVSSTHLSIIFPNASSGSTKFVLSEAYVDCLFNILNTDRFRVSIGEDDINVLYGKEMIEACLTDKLDQSQILEPRDVVGRELIRHLVFDSTAVMVLWLRLIAARKKFDKKRQRSSKAQRPMELIVLEAIFDKIKEASLSMEGVFQSPILTLQLQ